MAYGDDIYTVEEAREILGADALAALVADLRGQDKWRTLAILYTDDQAMTPEVMGAFSELASAWKVIYPDANIRSEFSQLLIVTEYPLPDKERHALNHWRYSDANRKSVK